MMALRNHDNESVIVALDFIDTFILGQIIGVIGYGVCILATQIPNRTWLITAESMGCLIVGLQWFVLGAPILAIMNVAYAIVGMLGIAREKHKYGQALYFLSIPIVLCAVLMNWESVWQNYAVTLAACFFLSSRFCLGVLKVRGLAICSTSTWLVLNALSGSIPGVICNILYGSGHARQMAKLLRAKKNAAQNLAVQPL